MAGLVSDTRAFLALMDTLRARPGSGPAWIYTNDGAQFIMAVLILGPALVALVMWLVYVFRGATNTSAGVSGSHGPLLDAWCNRYWVQHAQDLGDCILCRRRGARYDSLTLHNGTRLQYVPLRPGIHTFVALAAGSAFVSLMVQQCCCSRIKAVSDLFLGCYYTGHSVVDAGLVQHRRCLPAGVGAGAVWAWT